MNRPTPEHPAHPIGFDDPRISEWIDGRLSGGEAEFVARAVAASPELTRFVADLRLLKTAVADHTRPGRRTSAIRTPRSGWRRPCWGIARA